MKKGRSQLVSTHKWPNPLSFIYNKHLKEESEEVKPEFDEVRPKSYPVSTPQHLQKTQWLNKTISLSLQILESQ